MNFSDQSRITKNFDLGTKALRISSSNELIDLVVIGGGAAGFMGAITAAEKGIGPIHILESTSKILEKVRISGGGRCNITHSCWDPNDLILNYPRGQKELIGAFSRFATGDAAAWFERRGLELSIEEDGRMFPKANSSIEVIKCLKQSALKSGVNYSTKMEVIEVEYLESKKIFEIKCRCKKVIYSKTILIATGGNPSGKRIARALGHKPIETVPSIFTFKLVTKWLKSCSGISIDNLRLRLVTSKKIYEQSGRVLITHRGLSGPAVLRLSAFAARDLQKVQYKAKLFINWSSLDTYQTRSLLTQHKQDYLNKNIKSIYPFRHLPKKIWLSILNNVNINPQAKWSDISKKELHDLCEFLTNNDNLIIGKGPFGEEFVTAGGIDLQEVYFDSMESRICKGLYFAGEVLNVDGVTGGFNFQHCWTSGWLAGKAISKKLMAYNKVY